MVDIKKFIWLFPIIGAIFGIITYILPIMTYTSSSRDWYYWIWGLTTYRYDGIFPNPSISEDAFTNNAQLLTVSIISSIMILVAVILLLITSISSMRKIHYSKKFMVMTGFSAILLFVGGIIFRVEAGWPTTPHSASPLPGTSVWNLFNEGFSVYAPFIGGGIALLGIPLHYYVLKPRIEKSAKGKEFGLKTKGTEEKVDMKKYIWVFPIIGAIFGIITFLVPVISLNISTYYSIDWYYWIWGLTSYRFNDPDPWDPYSVSETAFTNNDQLLTVSIISSIIILVAVITLLIAGVSSKRNFRYSKKIMAITGFSAFLLIVGGIIFWVGADWPTTPKTGSAHPESVWDYFDEGFSVYTPFIGGTIALIGMSMHYILFKFRIEALDESGGVSLKIDEFREKIDNIYVHEKEMNEKIAKLEETQKQILSQISDLRKSEELENPPI